MSIMNTQQIMDVLPHRSPFLLIDTVEELQPGVKCVAKKNVTMNEPHFMGHFPGNPVMPGVLIIEALAQTGAVAILCQDEWKGKTAYFAGINNARSAARSSPSAARLTAEGKPSPSRAGQPASLAAWSSTAWAAWFATSPSNIPEVFP